MLPASVLADRCSSTAWADHFDAARGALARPEPTAEVGVGSR